MGLIYASVELINLTGEKITVQSAEEEICIIVLRGVINYEYRGRSGVAASNDMIYLPVNETLTLCGIGILTKFGAPCARKTSFEYLSFSEVESGKHHKVYGRAENGTLRDVWNCIDENFDSSRFLVGICHGAPGGWTAWPPHEHGKKREEVYVYYNMNDGFGLQCVYDDMERENTAVMVRDYHIVAIPGGYHPNVGCPKTGIHYVYCMVSITPEDRNFMDLKTQTAYGDRLE